MAAQTYPTTSSKVGQYNFGNWASIFSARFDEGYMEEINTYGLGSSFMDFLQLADQTINITTRTPKVFEVLEWEKTVKTATLIDVATYGAAGADLVFTIHADDIDSVGQIPVQVGEGIVLPGAYETNGRNAIYVITDITANVVTMTPLSKDGTLTSYQSQLNVDLPIGTLLKIHSYFSGYGTGQPLGHTQIRAIRTFNTTIVKTSMNYEGGIQALKWREIKTENGVNSAFLEGQALAEKFHSKKIDDALFLGEINDNSTLTEASQFGGTNRRASAKGFWNWAEEAGQDQLYAGTWNTSDLYDYKDLALSQNLIAKEILFLMGTDLQRMVEESGLDWIKEFSGGSDLFRTMNEIGYDVRSMFINGYHFMFKELPSFGNPLRWGNKEYDFTKYGIMVPNGMETYSIEGKTERHPTFAIGYLNSGGEDRTRIIRLLDGMSGRQAIAVDQYDGSNLYILSELSPILYRPNQVVRVMPQ